MPYFCKRSVGKCACTILFAGTCINPINIRAAVLTVFAFLAKRELPVALLRIHGQRYIAHEIFKLVKISRPLISPRTGDRNTS